MALGASFGRTPAGLEEQAQQAKKRVPTQQALQTLSLQLPKTLGAEGLAPSSKITGAYSPGDKLAGGVPDSSAAQMQRMVRAMTGRKPGAATPAPPRFTQSQSSRAPAPTAPAPGPAVPAMPTLPAAAAAARARVRSGLTGSKDPRKLIGQVKPPAMPPIDPTMVGGGGVDTSVSPPPMQAPAGPPPGSGAPPQYGGQGTPYNDANGGGSGGFVWDAQRGMWSQPGFTRGA